ncbi:branched-chain amino acid ABC transporter permease [Ruegeria sp.]|uniref:branched-chain amino acid ABC transporter permease n=1 Tax=Ruegeria sp. TaxID=1879320 RepID=UPI003C7EBB57
MELFFQQTLSGLATGAIYASIALAVVMIYQAIDHVNFAQGEMAMFSCYIAWQLMDMGVPYWAAFFLTIGLSFMGGVAIERALFAPIHNAPVLGHIVVFIALFQIFNAMAGFLWDFTIREFPSPFPDKLPFETKLIGAHEIGVVAVTLLMLLAIFMFFQHTRVGLAMRAAASAPVSARLVGINVGHMLAFGWGLAAAIGAVAGMMIAPIVFLEPNMMLGILVYGFAGAVVGGLTSPVGAVIGGFSVGVLENLAGTYVIGSELKLTFALLVIVTILIFKPDGLFGRTVVKRV